jgi:hypothetical protein
MKEGGCGPGGPADVGESALRIGLSQPRSEEHPMIDIAYRHLCIRVDAGWRHVVHATACQLDRRTRHDPALRFARKSFYLARLAEYRADQRDLANAFRL